MLELDVLLTAEQVAEILSISVSTLAIWRCTQRYSLAYVKVGRKVRYHPEDVNAFLKQQTKNKPK